MIQITLADLINSLRKAASNPEAHEPAQRRYFSKLQEDSVLVNCGSACCIAGDLMLQAHSDASEEEIDDILSFRSGKDVPSDWVSKELGLTNVEASLAFDANAYYEVHLLLADILEAGLRLHHLNGVSLGGYTTYTEFDYAYIGHCAAKLSLEELKSWMRSTAK